MKKKPARIEETAAPFASKKAAKAAKAGKTHRKVTAIIQREDDGFVALCPELDVASQGNTLKEARANLAEAVGLFLAAASPAEVAARLRKKTRVSKLAYFGFDGEELALHAAVSVAVAQDLGR